MRFCDYMLIRNHSFKNKGALSKAEIRIFNIFDQKRGWVKRHADQELTKDQIDRAIKARIRYVRKFPEECLIIRDMYSQIDFSGIQQNTKDLLYVMKNEIGMIKIGISKSPQTRRVSLENSSGLAVELIACYHLESNTYEVEQHLHKVFRARRMKGEWFNGEGFTLDMVELAIPCKYIRGI